MSDSIRFPSSETPSGAAPRALSPGDLTEAIPLRDALIGIGEVLQLPTKRPTAPHGVAAIGDGTTRSGTRSRNTKTIGMPAIPDTGRSYADARRNERRWLAGGAMGLALVIALGISVIGDAPRRDAMPSALRTEWRTAHPSYAHTVLSFTDSTVQIVTRDLASAQPDRQLLTRHAITGLEADRHGDEVVVIVRYLVHGEPDQIEARLANNGRPSLTFARPEGLTWYPATASAK